MKHRLSHLFAVSVILVSFAGNLVHPAPAAANGEDYLLYFKQSSFLPTQDEYEASAIYARDGVFGKGPVKFSPATPAQSPGSTTGPSDLGRILTGRLTTYYPQFSSAHGYYTGSYTCQGYKINILIGLTEVPQQNGFGTTQKNMNSQVWVTGGSKGGFATNGVNIPASCRPANSNTYSNNFTSPRNTSLPAYYGLTYNQQQDWFNFLKSHGQTIDTPPGPLGSNPTTPGGGGGGAGNDSAQLSCDAGFNPLNWLICAAIKGMIAVLNGVDNILNSQLAIGTPDNSPSGDPSEIFDTNTDTGQAYYKAWSSFRDIALGLLVIAGLTMIIAQALGMEVLDAYTIRKVLPRLIIMAILITLSWALLRFIIQMFNDLGYGLRFLIERPFSSLNNTITLSGGGGVAVALATGAGIVSLGIFGLFTFVLTGVLAVFTAFMVLVLRQVVVVALVILAPVALLFYILPNTQRLYKLWFDSFSGALIMFPLIVALIAAGRVFAAVANTNNPAGVGGFIAFVAYFVPYFMIPMTYRMAGGIMGGIGNFMNTRFQQPLGQRLSKYREGRLQQNMQALREGNRYRASNPFARGFNRATRGIATAPKSGVTPWKWRSRYQAAMSESENTAVNEYMEKSEAFKAVSGNDDYMQATMKSMGGGDTEADWRRYLSGQGYSGRSLEQGVAAIRLAKRDTNDNVFKQAAVRANASTGTGWKEGGAGAMMESINEAAGGDRDKAARMLADARQRATQARRVDLAGAGFGGQLMDMNAMQEGTMNADQATLRNNRKVLELNGPGAVAGARGDSMKLLAPAMMDELRSAYASGNDVTIKRSLAKAANLYDTISHAAPENAEIFADQVLAQPLDGSMVEVDQKNAQGVVVGKQNVPLTARKVMERFRDDDEFLNMRRELSVREGQAATLNAVDVDDTGGLGGLG